MQRDKTFGVVLFYAAVLTVALLILLAKVPIRVGGDVVSSGWQVVALGEQLELLVERTRLSAPAPSGAVAAPTVTWAFGEGCATFRGLVTFPQADGGESQVWLWAQPEAHRELRNPGRKALPGLTLYRDALRSDLVSSQDPGRGWIAIALDPAVDPQQDPTGQLLINNFVGQQALPSAAGVHRGLAEIVRPPQCNYLARDGETMELLTAVLRLSLCDSQERVHCHPAALTLYRDLVPDVYRLEGWALAADCGHLAARLRIVRDDAGRPTAAGFQVIEGATALRCVALLDAVAPAPSDQVPTRTRILGRLPDGGNKQGKIDFTELLAGTGWR
jgi:hypothetical protein